MPKLYVVGRRDDILPFKALGAELVEVEDATAVKPVFDRIKKENEPAIVLITEDLVSHNKEIIAEFRSTPKNMLLPVPSMTGPGGIRLEEIRSVVARALGVDLLGQKFSQIRNNGGA